MGILLFIAFFLIMAELVAWGCSVLFGITLSWLSFLAVLSILVSILSIISLGVSLGFAGWMGALDEYPDDSSSDTE